MKKAMMYLTGFFFIVSMCMVPAVFAGMQVAAGDYHTVGLKADGIVVAVGDNYYGQCDVDGWNLAQTTCTYTISPTSQSFVSNGGAGNVIVTTQSGCSWTVSSNDSWITITSGNSGTGNGIVDYSVSANSSMSSRTGTMTIAGQTFTVTQEGSATSGCLTWADVIAKYQEYVDGNATWADVIECYNQYVSQ